MNRFGPTMIALIFAAMLAFAAGTADAATKIKIATLVPQNSDWGGKIEAARAEIKQRTEGRVELRIIYGGVMGNASQVKQMIRIGQLHGGAFTPTDFQDKMPDLNLYGLPFVFESLDEVNYVRERMDSLLSEGFADEGFVTFGFAGDFAIILSNVPVRGLGDLDGRKIWLPEGDAISDRAMKKMRLVPSSQPLGDVLTGLKTGLFDVVAMPPAAALLLQLHTSIKYFTDMPVIYAMQFMAIQKRVFDKLTPDDQAVVSDVLSRVYVELNDQSPADAISAKATLEKNGIESIEPNDGEFDRLYEAMAENNRDMAVDGMYSLEMLELMQGYIEEYRSEHTGDNSATAAAGRE